MHTEQNASPAGVLAEGIKRIVNTVLAACDVDACGQLSFEPLDAAALWDNRQTALQHQIGSGFRIMLTLLRGRAVDNNMS